MLGMTVIVSPEVIRPGTACSNRSPPFILDQWEGHGEELGAPDWTRWGIGRTRELWCKRGSAAEKLMRFAIDRKNLSIVSCSCFN